MFEISTVFIPNEWELGISPFQTRSDIGAFIVKIKHFKCELLVIIKWTVSNTLLLENFQLIGPFQCVQCLSQLRYHSLFEKVQFFNSSPPALYPGVVKFIALPSRPRQRDPCHEKESESLLFGKPFRDS